jgi:hypothetical protein
MTDSDTVWVASNDDQTFHSARDCQFIEKLDSDRVDEKPAELIERSRREECQMCAGNHQTRSETHDLSLYRRAKNDWE